MTDSAPTELELPSSAKPTAAIAQANDARPSVDRRLSLSALGVSLTALILSQFHPLYTYLDKPKMSASIASNAIIYHGFGNLGMNLFVQIRNQGKAAGTVTRVELFLERIGDTNYRRRLPGQSYFVKPSTLSPGQSAVQVPMSYIPVAPDGSWENFINFYAAIPKEAQNRISELGPAIQVQIQGQFVQNPPARTQYRVDLALQSELDSFVAKNLAGFSVGDYYLLVMFWDDKSEKPAISQLFGFSVYEADMKSLASITEQYKSGIGIVFPPPQQAGFQATLHALQDEQVTARLRKEAESL